MFDNELIEQKKTNKPLLTFLNHVKLDSKKDEIKRELFIEIPNNKNLFIVTNPLVKKLSECEIEDLFDEQTLQQKINGKSFCRDSKTFDKNLHYSKEHFAKFVSRNYKTIDFSDFRPMLDTINSIIESHTQMVCQEKCVS